MGMTEMKKVDISLEVEDVIASVPPEEVRELLAKGRYSCESRWMMAMVVAAGWETANEMNRQVACDVGAGEMHRLMQLMGWSTPRSFDEFMLITVTAAELFLPKKYFDYEFRSMQDGSMLAILRGCLACTKVKSVGIQEHYECGCFGMRAGWYKAMGLEVKETTRMCMIDGDDQCEILIEPPHFSG
ncbi:MAG TPA: L-2-amino-thiazoline-4-carboxylic acid hydrolase [Candidatus Anoxymicrobiaceae bacterium]